MPWIRIPKVGCNKQAEGGGGVCLVGVQGLGEVIKVTSAEALKPSVVNITGPLIRKPPLLPLPTFLPNTVIFGAQLLYVYFLLF